ncbi:MAG: TIGR00730 family Rossman fold protein [Caulobacteraceae bacterium]|nr:TIGR00730 family Rossman fold protein [Caulobacter sp.]
MSQAPSPGDKPPGLSVCLFCGSSNAADPNFLQAAADFGRALAREDVRLVYGGGGIGLMGAAAKAAHAAGGKVLGVMPDFLRRREVIYDEVETVVVSNMHDRKRIMFEQSDAFAIFPGGVGTLEEVIELMSWRRLDLHRKPIVFLDMKGFWKPFFQMIDFTVDQKFTPPWLPDTWSAVEAVEGVLPAVKRMMAEAERGPGFFGYPDDATALAEATEVAAKA